MSAATRISMANLSQFLDHRNSEIKDKVSTMFVGNAKEILMKWPFSFSESMSSEVAEGIVNYGDKVMYNFLIEEEGEAELKELNDIGDKFQALQDSVTLKVISGDGHERLNHIVNDVRRLDLLSSDDSFTSVSKSESFQDTLHAVRDFLRAKAWQGFTAIIEMHCHYTEDGLRFTSGQTVPVEDLESQLQTIVDDRADQMFPMVVDVVVVKNGQYYQISQIQPDCEHVDRFVVNW